MDVKKNTRPDIEFIGGRVESMRTHIFLIETPRALWFKLQFSQNARAKPMGATMWGEAS